MTNIRFALVLLGALVGFYAPNLSGQLPLGSTLVGNSTGENYGKSVAISSDGLRIAASSTQGSSAGTAGYVQVFEWINGTWGQMGPDIVGAQDGEQSGFAIALSGDGNRIAIGAPFNNGLTFTEGETRILEWKDSVWQQVGKDINGEVGYDASGIAVSMSENGSHVAIGAPINAQVGQNGGHVRVYEWRDSVWLRKGLDIDAKNAEEQMGTSVALSADGQRVAMGGVSDKVRVFAFDGTKWNQVGNDIIGTGRFGSALAFSADGNRIALGAEGFNGIGFSSGQTQVYEWDGTAWNQLGNSLEGEAGSDRFGTAVALSADGEVLASSAPYHAGSAGVQTGQIKIYRLLNGTWSQVGADIEGDRFESMGQVMSLSAQGDRLIVGSPLDGKDGRAKVFDLSGIVSYDETPKPRAVQILSAQHNVWVLQGVKARIQKVELFDIIGRSVPIEAQIVGTEARIFTSFKGICVWRINTDQGVIVRKHVMRNP